MAKYTEQFKLQVVREYLSGDEGFRLLAQRYALDRGTLREWVAAYRHHGIAGLRGKRVLYTAAFKLSVLRHMRDEGLSLRQAAARFNIRGYGVVSIWQRRYDAGGEEALAPRGTRNSQPMQKPSIPKPKKDEERTRDELIDEVNYLRAEVAYLKKLDALVQAKKSAAQQKKRK